ncbi:histidine kinase [Mariprofundus ferrooxydans]|uniref:histidine kinase n=2 Tax=Mariprofundus ferrooxydans TaxID=314344 RepID=Q0F180_9PROT|nr:nitrogen regulation two-component system, histidine kinase [Mariprofundus ferrooxydans PV-1]KON47177.1 histidine kinase [Mariprofundus ferrooxydans]
MPLDQVPMSILPLPLIMLDTDARIIQTNLLCQEALGKSNRQLTGRHLSELFSPSVEIDRLLGMLTPNSGGISDHQLCMHDGGMPVSMHLGKHEDGMTVVFIPEAHRSEVEQHTHRHEMAEAVARIALEMAHEVKNPLAALKGATQWLNEQELSPSAKEASTRMLADVERIRERIDAFLQVGPRASIQMQPANIHALILDVCQPLDGIRLTRVFDPSLPETLVDKGRLRQALENLWQNAVEAADTYIEWQTRLAPLVHLPNHHGQVMEVRIMNDGEPVPEELRDRLFEPYVTGKKRGSGLGLALVQRVMLEHGGRISMRSEKGRTTMILHLPIRRAGEGK